MIIHSKLRPQMKGSDNGFFFSGWKGCDGGMKHEQERSSREEGIWCVGGRGGREWGRSGEGNKESEREREMMGIIRIKMVGFGQSRVRATVSMPTSYPPPVPSSGLNQLNWHMQGASMTHKQTTHGCRGNVPKSLEQLTKKTWFYAPDLTMKLPSRLRRLTGSSHLIWFLLLTFFGL